MPLYQDKIDKYKNKYPYLDWSMSEYTGCKGMMTAVCPKHGPVTKTGKHWNANGCPECGRDRMKVRVESKYDGFRAKSKEYQNAFKEKWNNLVQSGVFDLSNANFINSITAVTVVCKEHGISFKAIPKNLVKNGYAGCPKCRHTKPKGSEHYTTLLEKLWGTQYKYTEVPEYRHGMLSAECTKHGVFNIWLNNHLAGYGCPLCAKSASRPEDEVAEYVSDFGFGIIRRSRGLIAPLELDIYIPELKTAIEFNGLHWHADDNGSTPLRTKWERCNAVGIRLINIFEDEWNSKKDIVKSRIRSILGISSKVYARKCRVVDIDSILANKFHKNHHLNGPSGGSHTALIYDGDIKAVLTMKNHGDKWEVMRFTSSDTVVGGFSKLFSNFKKVYNPEVVISYCDLRYGNGGVYSKNGFNLIRVTTPDYFWFKNHVRHGRHGFQKHKLKTNPAFAGIYSDSKTEAEIATEAGYRRIKGVGHQLWEWRRARLLP